MQIGELARQGDVAASAIRYYERMGLLPKALRSSGRRVYGSADLSRLRLVQLALSAGFTLKETAMLVASVEAEGLRATRFQTLAKAKIAELDHKVRQLAQMRSLLKKGLACGCLKASDCAALTGV